jgi:hypothetical protein
MASSPQPQEKVNIQKAIDYLQLRSLIGQDNSGNTSPATVP